MAKIAAPPASPIQKPSKPFPRWRLPNGVTKASDDELEVSSESCERWAWVCGGFVVAAILGEFFIALAHQPEGSFWPVIGTATADAVIAAGVAGEIIFAMMGFTRQRELNRRSNERVAQLEFDAGFAEKSTAEALERAAKAELETAQLRADFGWRFVSGEQMPRLVHLLSQAAGPVAIIYSLGDVESESYATQFVRAFICAGWYPRLRAVQFDKLEFGLMVPESSDPMGQPSKTLRAALKEVSLPFGGAHIQYSGISRLQTFVPEMRFAENEAYLFVGPKPLPYTTSEDAKMNVQTWRV